MGSPYNENKNFAPTPENLGCKLLGCEAPRKAWSNIVGVAYKLVTAFTRDPSGVQNQATTELEVCMGMGKTGIPWVPWDSHGNGNKISRGMEMGWEWELSAWEWELRRGSWKKCCIL